jgi:hypothetical protein
LEPGNAGQQQASWAHFFVSVIDQPSLAIIHIRKHFVEKILTLTGICTISDPLQPQRDQGYSFCGAHSGQPQSHTSVVMSFESSQNVEQYFDPGFAVQLQTECAHFVTSDMRISSTGVGVLVCCDAPS